MKHTKEYELLEIIKHKYPDIYNQIEMQWRIEKTDETLKKWAKDWNKDHKNAYY